MLVVEGSKLFELDSEALALLASAESDNEVLLNRLLAEFGLSGLSSGCDEIPVAPPVRALSLAVAQKCNLGCSYCYASQGDFGSASEEYAA